MFAMLLRSFRTFLETAFAILMVDQMLGETPDIKKAIAVSVLAGILSLVMGFITGVPENRTEGELSLNTQIEESSVIAGLSLDKSITPEYIDDLSTRGTINLRIRRN